MLRRRRRVPQRVQSIQQRGTCVCVVVVKERYGRAESSLCLSVLLLIMTCYTMLLSLIINVGCVTKVIVVYHRSTLYACIIEIEEIVAYMWSAREACEISGSERGRRRCGGERRPALHEFHDDRRPAAVGLKKTEQNPAAGCCCWLFAKSQCLFYYYYYY